MSWYLSNEYIDKWVDMEAQWPAQVYYEMLEAF